MAAKHVIRAAATIMGSTLVALSAVHCSGESDLNLPVTSLDPARGLPTWGPGTPGANTGAGPSSTISLGPSPGGSPTGFGGPMTAPSPTATGGVTPPPSGSGHY
jgi:hypothetical protein